MLKLLVLVLVGVGCFILGWVTRKNSPNTAAKVDEKVEKVKDLVK